MNRRWRRFICTFLTSALVLTGPVIDGTFMGGYIGSGIEKVFAKTAKQKKKEAEDNLNSTNDKIDDLKDQQSQVTNDIQAKSDKLDTILAAQKQLQTDITNKQAEIEQNQSDLAAAQEQQQEQYEAMKKRIQFMYENSTEDNVWTAIIEAKGISDMLNRIEYVSDVYDSDRALMESYQAAVEQVKQIGEQLDKDMDDLTAMQDDYEKQQSEIEAAILDLENQKEQYASQITEAQQQAENYKNIINTQAAIIQQQEAAAAAAALRQQQQAQAAANSSSSSSSSGSSSYDGGGAGSGGTISNDYASGGGKNPSGTTGVSGSDVVAYASQFVGGKYVWGGNSLTSGVDCSGFVHEVYAHFGISTPRYSQAFKSVGQAVSFDNIQPGDVVVYPGHVAIYAGGGVIVEAQSTKAGITKGRSVQCHTILAIRRLV